MAYVEVDEPIILNETGQDIKNSLDDIKSAVQGLGTALGSDKANIDGSNIANPSAFRQAIGVDAIFIEGVTKISGLPTFAANSANAVTIDVTKSGYTPKGIIEITGSGTTGLVLQEFYISSNNAYVYFRNATSSSITPTRIRVVVFYIKN